MFNFFKKKKTAANGTEMLAVVDGTIMPITDVKDDVFSTKMLGDGFAIKPSDGKIYAPIDGEISTLFPTKHAIGIKTSNGLEILIHLGLDTVELKGAPFEVHIKQGDQVKKGDLLADMDLKQIEDADFDDTVIVVYTNMDLLKSVDPVKKGDIKHSEIAQTIHFND